jgi:lactate permease
MWYQTINPLHNIFASALVAAIPIILLFSLLISRKISGYVATLLTLLVALIIAIVAFSMPVNLAMLAVGYGVLNGLFPIGWIVFNAVFLYNISIKSGGFAIVRDSIESVTPDRRLQALLIAFCFGAFLEGSAGFGAPVAITAGMLVGLGFEPLYAAGICLIANTAPVAFGGIGLPVITSGHITNIDPFILSRMIAHQLPLIAFIVPFWLVFIISGWKGIKEIFPAIFITGASYALTMYLTASFLGPTLPDILSSIVSLICLVSFLKIWHPKEIWLFPKERANVQMHKNKPKYSKSEILKAWTPFLLLIIFIANWGNTGIQHILNTLTIQLPFGMLNHAIIAGKVPLTIVYSFSWLGAAGTAILLATMFSAILLGLSLHTFWQTALQTLKELWKPLVTIGSIVGFAYLANYSGMSTSIGNALTSTGRFFPLLSPVLGWLGVFITGSDTSSNALFSNIQAQTARSLGINPVLTVAANSSGGVTAKMISPQSIAVAVAAAKLFNKEGTLFRFTIPHSIGLLSIICIITYIQAYYAPWMIPDLITNSIAITKTSLGNGDILLACISLVVFLALEIFFFRYHLNSKNR